MSVRVFLAASRDGFVAGTDDDLSWLPEAPPIDGQSTGFDELIASCYCLLIGRRSYDVVRSLGRWPYQLPVFVATHRPLDSNHPEQVFSISGPITSMIKALSLGDIYLDGPDLITQALAAGLVDQATVTLIEAKVGRGVALPDWQLGPRSVTEIGRRRLDLTDGTTIEQIDYQFS